MTEQTRYPIGSPGQAWGETERAQWRARQVRRRVYADDVLQPVAALAGAFECTQYGVIGQGADTYPLMALRTPHWDAALPWALVTGGVHGYETSGVLGALQFLQGAQQRMQGASICWSLPASTRGAMSASSAGMPRRSIPIAPSGPTALRRNRQRSCSW